MDIKAANGNTSVPLSTAPEIPKETASENRSVIQAVKALNGTEMFGQENQLRFQRDPDSHRMVIQLVNSKTDEVVSQIPPEYLLRLADDLKKQQMADQSG